MEGLSAQIECLLIASAKPVSMDALRQHAEQGDVDSALRSLEAFWSCRGMVINRTVEHVEMVPAKEAAAILAQVGSGAGKRLSEAALETLCFIALNQPVTVKEIERARGVKLFKGVIDALMDAGFIRASMRKSDSGRALAYVTTDLLLEHFGLSSAADLPTPDELNEFMLVVPED